MQNASLEAFIENVCIASRLYPSGLLILMLAATRKWNIKVHVTSSRRPRGKRGLLNGLGMLLDSPHGVDLQTEQNPIATLLAACSAELEEVLRQVSTEIPAMSQLRIDGYFR